MKSALLIMTLGILTACTSTRPFRGPDGDIAYETSCNGSIRSMADCMENAADTCKGPYKVLGQDSSEGLATVGDSLVTTYGRSLMFKCK